jgi:hypothetical protein
MSYKYLSIEGMCDALGIPWDGTYLEEPTAKQLLVEGMELDENGQDITHPFYGLKHTEESKELMRKPHSRFTRTKAECPECGEMIPTSNMERHSTSRFHGKNRHDSVEYKQRAAEKYAKIKADPEAYRAHLDAHNRRRKINSQITI